LDLAKELIEVLEDKKAEKLVLLDIHNISSFTDYFIIGNGTSDRMLQALADAVLEFAKQKLGSTPTLEGNGRDGWLVVDLGNIVIHLFDPQQRNYYKARTTLGKRNTLTDCTMTKSCLKSRQPFLSRRSVRQTAASTSALCSAGTTFSKTLRIIPSGEIRNVVRATPKCSLPYIFFNFQTSYISQTA